MYLSFFAIELDNSTSYVCSCGNGLFQSHINNNYTLCCCIKCKNMFSMAMIGSNSKGNSSCLSKAKEFIGIVNIVDVREHIDYVIKKEIK